MPSPSLPELWLRGVAANPAAPSDVLLRLLAPEARAAWTVLCQERSLPADVIEAALSHPERAVRRAVARNRYVAPEQRGRLVDDPDAFVRAALASGPRPRLDVVEALPDDVLEALLTARDDDRPGQLLNAYEIRQELEFSRQIPASFRQGMIDHPHPDLRAQATGLWLSLTPAQREALLADPDPEVSKAARRRARNLDPVPMEADLPEEDCHGRTLLLRNYAISQAVAERCLAEQRDLLSLAANPYTPADIVARLARDPDPKVRRRVAARADLDPALLADLAEDPDEAVRTRARVQPHPRTRWQCVAIDQVVGLATECTTHTFCCVGPVGAMFGEQGAGWYEECAVSPEPLLHRVAASYAWLSGESVRSLAAHPDPLVRHLLALNHPLAPPAIVLDAFVAVPRQRPYLLTLSRLPRTGLGHLLDHADPEVRALAAADHGLAEPPVRLLSDPDPLVRRAAAANPLLPVELVSSLLDDPELAEGAAANPVLPAERLHRLLDHGGVPGTAT
ncbi:hypothetical protein [Kitasatospora sp. NPDC089509]|uniref:hypothetical protein n=1 Tax=Kitasatospora sp. NPDC089509 TaxID=3364079 RepID=UPI00380C23EF